MQGIGPSSKRKISDARIALGVVMGRYTFLIDTISNHNVDADNIGDILQFSV